MTTQFILAGFAIIIFLVMDVRLKQERKESAEERRMLIEQMDQQFYIYRDERNTLMNRLMARNLDDYRQSVVVEAQAKSDDSEEKRRAEHMMDAAYGIEWRSEV